MPAPAPAVNDRELPATPKRDEARFDALVRAEYAALVTFVTRMVGSRDVAEDVAQDVFAGMWRNLAQVRMEDARGYLYRSARNRALDTLRNEKTRERLGEEVIRESASSVAPIAETNVSGLAAAVAVAVERLPERTRAVFLLSRDQGLTYAEIARAMDIAPKTVEAQMARAFRMLRQALRPFMEG